MSIERIVIFTAIATVITLSIVEGLVLMFLRKEYDWRAFSVSLFDLSLRQAILVFLPFTLAAPLVQWVESHRIASMSLDSWTSALVLFLLLEFVYYWLHRASHRVRWFWANHSVHHTPNELTLSAGFRVGALGKMSGTVVFLLPLVWIGFDTRVALTALSLNLLFQFWLHNTWIPKLGWLEYVINTPSAHRVHHASNTPYLDANYGGVLIVFDRLFGTYVAERDDLPCRYGLVHPQTSNNPLVVEFAQWAALMRDLARSRSLREVVGYLAMPPGWSPAGGGNTTEELRARGAENATAPAR